MTELDESTKELMEQFKRRVAIRPLYLYEWFEYYNTLKDNIAIGLSDEVKREAIERLLNEESVELLNEEEKATFQSLGDSFFPSAKLSRLAKN